MKMIADLPSLMIKASYSYKELFVQVDTKLSSHTMWEYCMSHVVVRCCDTFDLTFHLHPHPAQILSGHRAALSSH